MIANVSPSSITYEDTLNTLKYADRAKKIKEKNISLIIELYFTDIQTAFSGFQSIF